MYRNFLNFPKISLLPPCCFQICWILYLRFITFHNKIGNKFKQYVTHFDWFRHPHVTWKFHFEAFYVSKSCSENRLLYKNIAGIFVKMSRDNLIYPLAHTPLCYLVTLTKTRASSFRKSLSFFLRRSKIRSLVRGSSLSKSWKICESTKMAVHFCPS